MRPTRTNKHLQRILPAVLPVAVLLLWQLASVLGLIPRFMLPSPVQVLAALIREAPVLLMHSVVTLGEALAGLLYAVVAALMLACAMDEFESLHRALYPLLLITQAIPAITLAPLLVLWMGYGYAPKICLVFLACFFPMCVALLDGLRSTDAQELRLLRSMGAGKGQILRHLKLPSAMPSFFSGLKISASYAVVGGVIAEWLGGDGGLGVYMTRVRKSYSYDKMFAVIIVVCLLSLGLMWCVGVLSKVAMPWKKDSIIKEDL